MAGVSLGTGHHIFTSKILFLERTNIVARDAKITYLAISMRNGLLLLSFTWWVDSLTVGVCMRTLRIESAYRRWKPQTLVALSNKVVLLLKGSLGK